MSLLQVKDLSHSYDSGKTWAVNNINLEIKSKGVIGLLGSNGAGKSTTMNIVCGVLNQSRGIVEINGIDILKNPTNAKRQIGFLPQDPPLYLDLTVFEYLSHCAKLRLIDRDKVTNSVNAVMEKVQVTHFRDRILKNLSGGYRQRVGIAQAIIHKPQLVILDEPTVGLDPNQIIEVRNIVSEIAEERAVLFSTHILTEVDQMCRDVIMIENGQVVFNGTLSSFREIESPESLIVRFDGEINNTELIGIPGVKAIETLNDGKYRLMIEGNNNLSDEIIRKAVANNWVVQEIYFEQKSLDSIFSKLSKK